MRTLGMKNAVFIVTGTNLAAEQKDRPLAYFLKGHIDSYGGNDPSKCGVVVTDGWYMSAPAVHALPVISLGPPGINVLSRSYWHRLPVALAIDGAFVIQLDVAFEDLRASIWGTNCEAAREAVQTFYSKGYLRRMLEAVWDERLKEHEDEIVQEG